MSKRKRDISKPYRAARRSVGQEDKISVIYDSDPKTQENVRTQTISSVKTQKRRSLRLQCQIS